MRCDDMGVTDMAQIYPVRDTVFGAMDEVKHDPHSGQFTSGGGGGGSSGGGKLHITPQTETRHTAMGAMERKTGDFHVHEGEKKIGTIKKQFAPQSGGIVRSSRGGAKTGATTYKSAGFTGHHEPSDTYHQGATANEVLKKMQAHHSGS
jgi:hypothetical protein